MVRRWFSLGAAVCSTTYMWLATIWQKSDDNQNSCALLLLFLDLGDVNRLILFKSTLAGRELNVFDQFCYLVMSLIHFYKN